MSMDRGILVPLMFSAQKGGSSFNAFYRSAQEQGISQKRSTMLSDWRDVKGMLASRDALAGLDPTAYPVLAKVKESAFHWSEPFVYQARVEAQLTKKSPMTEQFVTIVSPEALTMGEIDEQIHTKWKSKDWNYPEKIVGIEFVAAINWLG